jgi:mRNA-degrading endonuclease RelE of RelBE toxin-antitoxin system
LANYIVVFTKKFDREMDKLSQADQEKVMSKISVLENNPFYPSLRTKKFHGMPGYFESSVNMDIRILWYFEGGRIILVTDVGHHDLVK